MYANTYVLVFSLCVCVCVVTGMANSRIRNSSLSSALCSRVKQPSMHSTPIRVEPLISISASSCTLAPRRDDDASVRFRKINLIPRTSFVPIQFSHSLSLTHTHACKHRLHDTDTVDPYHFQSWHSYLSSKPKLPSSHIHMAWLLPFQRESLSWSSEGVWNSWRLLLVRPPHRRRHRRQHCIINSRKGRRRGGGRRIS